MYEADRPEADGVIDADVLIVEDDVAIADMYSLAMSLAGLRVRVVRSGQSAVADAARHARYGVIVLDLELPQMGGWTALDALRRLEATADVPVIVVSNADIDSTDVESHGASEWHAKYRTTPGQLVDRVQRVRLGAA